MEELINSGRGAIHWVSVCGERRAKSGTVPTEGGVVTYVVTYKGEDGKGGGRIKSPRGRGMMVWTAGVACYYRGSKFTPLAKIEMMK